MADDLIDDDEEPAVAPVPGKGATAYTPDEFDEDQDDAGEVEGDEGPGAAESSLLDGIEDVDDDEGHDAPMDRKQSPDGPNPALSVVPTSAAGYKIPEIDGLTLTDADKPALQGFMDHAAKVGANQAAINAGLAYYQDLRAAQVSLDATTAKEAKAELMAELGPDDFKIEAGRMKHMLRSMPDLLGDDIRDARLPDGRRLVNDPRFFRWASNQNERTRVRTPTDRIKQIEKVMKIDMRRYRNEGLDKEYTRLLADRERS